MEQRQLENPYVSEHFQKPLLNKSWVKEVVSHKEFRKYFELKEVKMQHIRICGMQLKEKIIVLNTHTRKKKGQKGRNKGRKRERKRKEPQIND